MVSTPIVVAGFDEWFYCGNDTIKPRYNDAFTSYIFFKIYCPQSISN